MRSFRFIFAACLIVTMSGVPSFAGSDDSTDAPTISCGNGVPGGVNCTLSKKELKQARKVYSEGLKLKNGGKLEESYAKFDEASRLNPKEVAFLSARESTKAQLVFQHTERAEALLAGNQPNLAQVEFRAALDLDPDNEYLQNRLRDTSPGPAVRAPSLDASLPETTEIHLQPNGKRTTFQFRGDVRGMFNELATAYGVTVEFDDSVTTKTVRFYVDDVDFFTALSLACRVSKTMWTALSVHQLLIAADTKENHNQFDRMSLATFSVPGATTPQQATELVNSLKNVCEFQKISPGQLGTVEVRAPQATLAACTKLLQQLTSDRPEVAFDLDIYQVSHNFTREIGMHIPNTFNMYNIPQVAIAAAIAALGSGQNLSSLANQLISSGGINGAGNSALSGLLAQLQGQAGSIFSQPLATFGNGLSFSGVSLDHLSAALSLNESWATSLSHVTLRAEQGNDATFHLGERYPILNASYSPLSNSSALSAVLGNQSYVAPFPSVSYEDLGLSLKAKPTIHGDGEVTVALEMQVRSLTGQSANGVPYISNQEYKGSIRLRDGEGAVIAGEITTNDQLSMAGIPAIAAIPLLTQIASDNTRMKENDELLIVITPHVLANHNRETDEIWVTQQ